MILLGILVYILSFTCFIVYWEVLAAQAVPAVLKSQGSVQQLWAAGTTCSWATPSLGCALLLHTLGMVEQGWEGWGRYLCNPRNYMLGCGLAVCVLGRAEEQPYLRIFLFSQVYWHLWSNSLGTHCILWCWFFPAKLYIKYVSTDVGSREQSMYMHISDVFS